MSSIKKPRKRISRYHSVIRKLADLYDRDVVEVNHLYNRMGCSIEDTKSILNLTKVSQISNPLTD